MFTGIGLAATSVILAAPINIGTFFTNLKTTLETWGGAFIGVVGAIMLIWAAIQIATAFISHGRGGHTNWLMIILMIIIGGCFFAGGFGIMKTLADVGKQTLEDLSNGPVSPTP